MRPSAAGALALLALLEWGCKPPRSPREVSLGSVTGEWTAESTAASAPEDTGRVSWSFSVREREAGKLRGEGAVEREGRREEFTLSGVRGESKLDFQFALGGESVKYRGSVTDPETIVGEVYLERDTVPVTLVRRPAVRR